MNDTISKKEEDKDTHKGDSLNTKVLKWFFLKETFAIVYKFSGVIIWLFVFLLALLEFKRYYNIDVIPNYDSSVDDFYGMIKGTLSEFFGGKN